MINNGVMRSSYCAALLETIRLQGMGIHTIRLVWVTEMFCVDSSNQYAALKLKPVIAHVTTAPIIIINAIGGAINNVQALFLVFLLHHLFWRNSPIAY